MKQVLFLCTGNYYRSRFAECVFNHKVREKGISWRAQSRGLRVQAEGVVNVGAISVFTLARLRERKIAHEEPLRHPRQVSAAELGASAIIVALKEKEHRPLLEALHPEFAGAVRYWQVHDLDAAMPEQALAEIEARVDALIAEISAA